MHLHAIRQRLALWLAPVLLAAGLSACSSGLVLVSPQQPVKYQVIGKTEGRGCGSLGLLGTAYYFVPMGLNERVDGAYQDALQKVPGATGLVNVEIRENWFWWVIGTVRCTYISGDAIKEVKE
ncbi:MAG: hypothetical protein QM776_15030 [Rhodocyclaceae bacterium]